MQEPFVFYRALDPQKGSWDGYGVVALNGSDFLVYVADAPSGASIQTPELIANFLIEAARAHPFDPSLGRVVMADTVNRLQDLLHRRSRSDAALYQSTLCMARKCGNRLFYVVIGDSMLFLLRDGSLYRLDTAETWNGALVARAGDELRERQKTGPTRFVGVDGSFVDPAEVQILDLQPRDRLALASDGLMDSLTPSRLLYLMRSNGDAMRAEMERAFSADRLKDDVTLLIVDPEIEPVRDLSSEIHALRQQIDQWSTASEERPRPAITEHRRPAIEERRRLAIEERRRPGAEERRRLAGITGRRPLAGSWLYLIVAFAAGTILGLSFFLLNSRAGVSAQQPVSPPPLAERRPSITPPEIVEPVDCLYRVQSGDTLTKIATAKNLTVQNLLRLNPELKGDTPLQVGREIQVCAGGQL